MLPQCNRRWVVAVVKRRECSVRAVFTPRSQLVRSAAHRVRSHIDINLRLRHPSQRPSHQRLKCPHVVQRRFVSKGTLLKACSTRILIYSYEQFKPHLIITSCNSITHIVSTFSSTSLELQKAKKQNHIFMVKKCYTCRTLNLGSTSFIFISMYHINWCLVIEFILIDLKMTAQYC